MNIIEYSKSTVLLRLLALVHVLITCKFESSEPNPYGDLEAEAMLALFCQVHIMINLEQCESDLMNMA